MITRLVDAILNLSPAILGTWGYCIVFVISIAESLPLIGFAIPGGIVVIAAGFFAKIGILDLAPTIAVVAAGAFLGDSISFALGRKYGYSFLMKIGKYIFFKPIYFEKAKKVLNQHPGKTIFGGRFHSLTRCIIPFAAGSAEVGTSLFLVISGLSAILWSITNVLIGYIFGSGFEAASHYLGPIFFISLVLSVLMLYSYEFISRFTEKNKHVLSRYQVYPLILNIISIYIVAKISESVIVPGRLHHLDIMTNNFFALVRNPILTNIFIGITFFATPTNLVVISVALLLYFVYRHRWYFLILLPAALLSGVISDSLLKKIVHIARPLYPLVPTTDFSFPSGHATVAVIFFGLLAYFFKDTLSSKIAKNIYIFFCSFAVLVVCLSRLYLNAHWFSDVVAGAALGLFWLTFYIVLFRFFTSLSPHKVRRDLAAELKSGQDGVYKAVV